MTFRTYNLVSAGVVTAAVLLVSLVNVIVDPGSIYLRKYLVNSEFDLYARTLVATRHGLIADGWNERSTKLALAKLAGRFDCAVVGSSHVMSVSLHRQPSAVARYCGTLVNLGMSGAGIEDLVIVLYTMASENQTPRRVFIGIDPWTLNFNTDVRWREHEDVYRKGLAAFKADAKELHESYSAKLLANLINADYFAESVRTARQKGIGAIVSEYSSLTANRRRIAAGKVEPAIMKEFDYSMGAALPVTLPDGSLVYSKEHLDDARARRLPLVDHGFNISEGMTYDDDAVRLLTVMVGYLEAMRVEVFFLLTPYHQNVWNARPSQTIRTMTAVSQKVHQLGAQHGVRTLGSFNPRDLGCTEDEFFDYMHPTQSCLNKIFEKGGN